MMAFIEKLLYTLLGFWRIICNSKWSPEIKQIKVNKSSCFILGNGPSLNEDINGNISYFVQQNLMAVNFFVNSDLYSVLKPSYYVVADPIFFDERVDEKRRLMVSKMLEDIKRKTQWEMFFIVPVQGVNTIKNKLKENHHIKVVDYNIKGVRNTFKWFDHWIHDKQLATYGSMNVVNVATYLATYLGFKEINLMGVDHSWHMNFVIGDDNLVYIKDTHFYDVSSPKLVLAASDPGQPLLKLHEQLNCSVIALNTYFYIKNYADYKKIKIYNCCKNSFIDAFERKTINFVP